MNYYPFHIGDYLSATRHLSWEEDAAFRRLLDTYYITEKPIPADARAACRLVMAQTESQREAVRVVLEEFFVLTDDGWINKRADAEIAAMRVKQQQQRDKANKRWKKPSAEPGNATAFDLDAVASDVDAVAMPPTPTPTPVNTHTPLAADWKLSKACGDWAMEAYPHWTREVVLAESAQFADHARTNGAESEDWDAAWRNWCRDGITQKRRKADAPKKPRAEKAEFTVTVPSDEAAKTAAYLAEQSARVHDPPPNVSELLKKAKQSVGTGSLRVVA